jgi:hypothetical protein
MELLYKMPRTGCMNQLIAGERHMLTSHTDRVWLVPQRFWSATKKMSAEETERLIEHLMFLSEVRDFESLRKFDFIVVGKVKWNRNAS